MSKSYTQFPQSHAIEHIDMLIAAEPEEDRKESFRLLRCVIPALNEYLDDASHRGVGNKFIANGMAMALVDLMGTTIINTVEGQDKAQAFRLYGEYLGDKVKEMADDVAEMESPKGN